MSEDYPLEATIYKKFTTRQFSDGVPTVLAGTPVVSVYENENLTQITAGVTLGVDHDSVVGLNLLTIVCTAANGYETGKHYAAVITTGTVGGVSVVGEVVEEWSIEAGASAIVMGTQADSAVDGDPTTTDTLVGYVKQLVNTFVGTAGVVTFPAEQAPANGINLAEIIRAIHADVTGLAGAAMRGTDSAALSSVVGALADAAADGDPTSADTLMQYVKQLVNTFVGTAGVVAFPAEQAPANGINLAEVIRAIHADVTGLAGAAMRGTDSAALASVVGALADAAADGDPTAVDTLMQYVKQLVNVLVGSDGVTTFPAEQAPANGINLAEVIRAIHADVTGLAGGTVAAIADAVWDEARADHTTQGTYGESFAPQLSMNVDTVVNTHTPTTTEFQSDSTTEATADHFKGRLVQWIDGVLKDQVTDITGYSNVGGIGQFTVTAMTEAPSNNDKFVIF